MTKVKQQISTLHHSFIYSCILSSPKLPSTFFNVPLSVPNPTAASASFCECGSSRSNRILSQNSASIPPHTVRLCRFPNQPKHPQGAVAQHSSNSRVIVVLTSAYDSSRVYARPNCTRSQTTSRTRRSSAGLALAGPRCPLSLCTARDAATSRCLRGLGRSPWPTGG